MGDSPAPAHGMCQVNTTSPLGLNSSSRPMGPGPSASTEDDPNANSQRCKLEIWQPTEGLGAA